MHRIQKIFVSRKKSPAASTFKPNPNSMPKLERQNAVNSFDFDLPSTSSSFSSWDDQLSSASASASSSAAQKIPCVDISSLDERTSFRIEGKCPDEFDVICRSLGLSGAEDFSIPAAEWEEMKVRSSSNDDAFPRISRFNFVFDGGGGSVDVVNSKNETPGLVYTDVASLRSEGINNEEVIQKIEYTAYPSTPVRVSSEGLHKDQEAVTSGVGSVNRLGDSLRGTQLILNKNEPFDLLDLGKSRKLSTEGEIASDLVSSVLERFDEFGITGNIDNALRSTPDILRLFVSEDDQKLSRLEVCEEVSYEDEEDGEMDEVKGEKVDEEEVHNVVARRSAGEDGLLLESYLFTTLSNDDDPSRTTTKHMSNVSPNGKFRRIITYWEKGELLGRGSFGSVYEGIADNGFFFAVKEVSLLDQGEEGRQSIYQLEQEIALLSQFEHDNIVRYYGTDKDESKLYIFLELVTKGSILSLYQKYHLQDSQVSAYTRQILHGLKYLHDRNVVHRDIKCANILVDASGSVKLADFGLAKATRRNDVKSFKGTALWMAPEVVNRKNQGYGLAADIWSLGCTVLEMLTRQFPYSHLENPWQALYRIGRGEPPPVPQSLSRDAREFIFECLKVNPSARLTAAQLLDHAFVKRSIRLSGSASLYYPSQRVH